MKANKLKAELVTEFAKELVYRRDYATLANQFEVTREQDRRLRDLLGQVDFVVHDSAIPLGIIYATGPYAEDWNVRRTWEMFDGYNNFNVFVRRKKRYEAYGRTQTEEEARALDVKILDLFGQDRLHLVVDGDEDAVQKVFEAVTSLKS